MPDLDKPYERKLRARILTDADRIRGIYEDLIDEVARTAAALKYQGGTFSLSQYPAIDKQLTELLDGLRSDLYAITLNGVKYAWALSNDKNDAIVDTRVGGAELSPSAIKLLYDPSLAALESFIGRAEKGLNLSKRIYKSVKPFTTELTKGLALGISQGQSANAMATDLKKYLKNPDMLFRRVRDAEGKLKLSKAARDYHPGQGIYRSSFKNARRLTATETNLAYRSSDHHRIQNIPFVVGIEVHTSGQHPKYDICDELKGKYPKEFYFPGWHPQCLCYQTSIMMTDAEYDKYEDAVLAGTTRDLSSINQVTDVPAGFTRWIEENHDRIDRWKTTPYWITKNAEYL